MAKEFGKHYILYLPMPPWRFIQLKILKFPQLKKDQKVIKFINQYLLIFS